MAAERARLARARRVFAWVGLLLAAWAVAVPGLDGPRLHPDEAHFASFARRAAVQGDWWLSGPLDKPPLAIYAQALAMHSAGVGRNARGDRDLALRAGEVSARLPALFSVPLLACATGALARGLGGRGVAAWLAGGLAALSPFSVAFAATAFTDMPMLLSVALACALAARGHPGWAGVWLGVAVACKPQGALAAPLVLLLTPPRAWARLVAGAAPVVALLLAWNTLRPAATDALTLGAAHNALVGLWAGWEALPGRIRAWGAHAGWLLGPPWLTGALLLALLAAPRRAWPLTVWAGGVALLHVIVPVPPYDRYVLLLLPALAAAIALGLARWLRARQAVLGMVVLALLLGGGRAPVGGDWAGAYDGILGLAADLNARPFGSIVYDRWLGWPLDYYLGTWSDKRRAYYPTPEAMVADPALYADDAVTRAFPAPADADFAPWAGALRAAGFGVARGPQYGRFVVWELSPPTG